MGSLILIFLEGLITIITLGLPQPIIRFCYNRSKNLFNSLSSTQGRQSRSSQKSRTSSIANSSDFVDLCALFGYYAEEHIVQTGDGYLLGLHRLCWRKGEEGTRVNASGGGIQKRVVYLHHGLLMNSEVWVCLSEEQRCLPFMLVEKGYDVWVGPLALVVCLVAEADCAIDSWEIIEETNTPRSPLDSRQHQMTFGISPWTNLLFTTFPTALTIF